MNALLVFSFILINFGPLCLGRECGDYYDYGDGSTFHILTYIVRYLSGKLIKFYFRKSRQQQDFD